MKRTHGTASQGDRSTDDSIVGLRIIGGSLRGRKLQYSGDVRTRPMKDRVREAVFNLIGPSVVGSHAIDLFAGTGALGLEAVSRGAARATLIERHLPTVRLIEQNVAALQVGDRAAVVFSDAFVWTERFATDAMPLTVFISPPFDFYVDQQPKMAELIERWHTRMAAGSQIIVECDERFDVHNLPQPDGWDVRRYDPAIVAIISA